MNRRLGALALGALSVPCALGALVAFPGAAPAEEKKLKPFPTVEILYNTAESHKQIAEALTQMWKKELGVTVSLANTEWKVYLDKMSNLDYSIARAGWVWDYNDPHNIFECWTTGNGNNRTGWSSKKYDDLIAKAMTQRDNAKRWEIYHEAEKIVTEECPILPIYFYVNKNMIDLTKVKGWYPNVLNLHPYDEIWIEKDGKPAPAADQKLVFNNAAEPATLDPAIMTGVPEHRIALALYEGLCRLDPKTVSPLPGVAEKWEISEDGKTYAFHLRADAKWSNGDPVTAEDFVWSWMRIIDPAGLEEPSEYAAIFEWIEGAKAVMKKAPGADLKKVGIEAKDARTLVVKLAEPCPFWLNLCAFETTMPVHRKTLEANRKDWTRPEKIVTNGPFQLKEWKPTEKLVFVPCNQYWGRARVKLQEMTFLPIENQDTALNKFLGGECDWLDDVPIARADDVKKHPHFTASPFLAFYYYRFNTTKPPFDDVRVRRAFAMAIDKRTICRDVQRFGEIPANGLVPNRCGEPPYKTEKGLMPYDPAAARKLLREAGYEAPE